MCYYWDNSQIKGKFERRRAERILRDARRALCGGGKGHEDREDHEDRRVEESVERLHCGGWKGLNECLRVDG